MTSSVFSEFVKAFVEASTSPIKAEKSLSDKECFFSYIYTTETDVNKEVSSFTRTVTKNLLLKVKVDEKNIKINKRNGIN